MSRLHETSWHFLLENLISKDRRARGRRSRAVERTRAVQHEDSWSRHRKPSKFDAAELRAALHCTLRILPLAGEKKIILVT